MYYNYLQIGQNSRSLICSIPNPKALLIEDNKAELPQEGILFCTQFPSLGIFINKKVGFRKN